MCQARISKLNSRSSNAKDQIQRHFWHQGCIGPENSAAVYIIHEPRHRAPPAEVGHETGSHLRFRAPSVPPPLRVIQKEDTAAAAAAGGQGKKPLLKRDGGRVSATHTHRARRAFISFVPRINARRRGSPVFLLGFSLSGEIGWIRSRKTACLGIFLSQLVD